MATKTYNVGIYCRLSNDDERDGESVSIENQKLLLQNYVRQRGWNEVDTYIDDGYSGTNFDRPGVKTTNRGRQGQEDQCDSGQGPVPFWP